MGLRIEKIDGMSFAAEASSILREAWANQSAMDYTPEYMAWQFGFPGAIPPIGMAVFEGSEPVGFAGATVRRLRLGANETDGFVTSFWGMRPGRGGPVGPIWLVEDLLKELRQFDVPVLTFGLHNGRGERLFPQSYARAGYLGAELGSLPGYSYPVRSGRTDSDWIVTEAESTRVLPELISQCASEDPTFLFLSPDHKQLEHYTQDPRSRRLLVATDTRTGARAAAWAIRAGVRTAAGVAITPSLDSVIVGRSRSDALPALLRAAAEHCPSSTGGLVVVNAPSLAGFDPKALRSLGIRQTSGGFHGHLYLPPSLSHWQLAKETASEVI